MISFESKVLLKGSCGFVVEHIFKRHCHLPGYDLHEINVHEGISLLHRRCEMQSSQAAPDRQERQHTISGSGKNP